MEKYTSIFFLNWTFVVQIWYISSQSFKIEVFAPLFFPQPLFPPAANRYRHLKGEFSSVPQALGFMVLIEMTGEKRTEMSWKANLTCQIEKPEGDFPGDPVAKTPVQEAGVQSLVRELDPTCHN